MAKGYRPVARDQGFLLPPDMADWLGADHPVWLVIEVTARHLDTSAAHAARRTGGPGAAGYDPDMLVALLTWAYAHRVVSSRQIERLCRTDVAFRVICGGGAGPDHVTIARFRAGLGAAAGDIFAGVLALCARLGMGQLGVVALDGTKIKASASAEANRTEDQLRKLAAEMIAAHAAADAAEDELYGPGARGDEVPPELAGPRSRSERITAALAGLEAERRAAQAERDTQASAYLAGAAAGTPPAGGVPKEAGVAAAQIRLERAIAAQLAKIEDWDRRAAEKIAATGAGLSARRPRPPSEHNRVQRAAAKLGNARQRAAERDRAAAEKEKNRKGPGPVRNLTDPHSRLMPVRGGGFVQGYNAQLVTSQDGLIIATALTQDTTDTPWFEPMLRQAQNAAALITASRPPGPPGEPGAGQDEPIGLILADAGYLSEHNLTTPGPDRLIATGKNRKLQRTAQDPRRSGGAANGSAVKAMAARLATDEGIATYRHRAHIAETPNANIKHNNGFRQLSLRGKPRATTEWLLACTVHNLFKAITGGHLTRQALTALAS